MNIRTAYNEVGARVRGLWYRIDTTNACGLSCPTCARAKFKTPKGFMRLDLFKEIIDKALKTRIRTLELYAWGDSMLNPNLHEYCEYAVSKKIKTITVSSNMNTIKCDLPKVMMSGISTVFVSFSGWKKYHITHRGGDLDTALDNFEYLASLPKHPNTRVVMRFHIYRHNVDEIGLASTFARRRGWEINAYEAQWMENASLVHKALNNDDKVIYNMLMWRPDDGKRNQFCYYQTKQIVIDANGRTYLCCVTPYTDEFKTGDFLKMDLQEIRKNMRDHPFCVLCKKEGLNSYQTGRGGI